MRFDAKRTMGTLLHGMVATQAPRIAKGLINQYFREYKVNARTVMPLVEKNQSLWKLLPKKNYLQVKKALNQVGDIEWLTSDWLMANVKEEHPGLVSLFLSWRKARNWLDRQIEEIKKEVQNLE